MLRAHGVTDKGRVRPTNEDCFSIDALLRLCIVADGMGGHQAGEVASKIAVATVADHVRSARPGAWPFGYDEGLSDAGNLLRTALHVANARVHEAAGSAHHYSGMGTTLVAIVERNGLLSVAHVGDSRLYIYRGGRLEQLTRDDSWIAILMARQPDTDRTSFHNHPLRNALTSVIGSRPSTNVHVTEHRLSGGERLVMTTDGVHGVLDEGRIAELIAGCPAGGDGRQGRGASSTGRTPGEAPADALDATTELPARLVEAALSSGSRDNCTAVVADYVPE